MLFYVLNLATGAIIGAVVKICFLENVNIHIVLTMLIGAILGTFLIDLCRIKVFRTIYYIVQSVFLGLSVSYLSLMTISGITHKYANYPINAVSPILIPYYSIWIILFYTMLVDGAYKEFSIGYEHTDLNRKNIKEARKAKKALKEMKKTQKVSKKRDKTERELDRIFGND